MSEEAAVEETTTETTETTEAVVEATEAVTEPVEATIAERPEYIPEKFWNAETGEARLEDAFKSYKHLETKMSGKNMAPESYETVVPDGLEIEIGDDDPLLGSMHEAFREAGMTQDQVNMASAAWFQHQAAELAAVEEIKKSEMAALGANGPKRLSAIGDWLQANFRGDVADALSARVDSAVMVEALEGLISLGRPPSLAPENMQDDVRSEHEKLKEEQFAVDGNGKRKMSNPQYAAEWRRRAAAAGFNG